MKWECTCACHKGVTVLHDHACCSYCYECGKSVACGCVICSKDRDFDPEVEHKKKCKGERVREDMRGIKDFGSDE